MTPSRPIVHVQLFISDCSCPIVHLRLTMLGGQGSLRATPTSTTPFLSKHDAITDAASPLRAVMGHRHPVMLHTRLLAAARRGDVASVQAALADGASATWQPSGPRVLAGAGTWNPLVVAAMHGQASVVPLLLSHGCHPNDAAVMHAAAYHGNADVLSLLLAAGGSVNAESVPGWRPVFSVIAGWGDVTQKLGLLLSTPALDLSVTKAGLGPEPYARALGKRVLANVIRDRSSQRVVPTVSQQQVRVQ